MKRKFSFAVLLLLIGAPAFAGGNALTLEEAFQKAVARSESLAIKDEDVRVAAAHYLQALGTVLPHLDVNASEIIQDTPPSTLTVGGGNVGNTFTRRSRPEVAITLTQPLFQGLREFMALKVAGAEKRRNTFTVKRARQLLFSDVARAYYGVIEAEKDLSIEQSIRTTLVQRIKELKDRIALGKSRESELLNSESQQASLEAQIAQTQGTVQTSRDILSFLTGDPVVEERLVDQFQVPPRPGAVETFIAGSDARPDIAASREDVRLSKGRVDYEKGARYPMINFTGNYYPYRVGFQKDIDWDLTFAMTLPLFHGGETKGRIREAQAQLKQSELSRDLTERQTESDIREAYHTLLSTLNRESALRRAESKANANYGAQLKDYQLGLVNNLDVLIALRSWQETRQEVNLAHYETKLRYLQLLVASGRLDFEAPQ